jgi:eukaryotic-like serine/threonine-protein kinase
MTELDAGHVIAGRYRLVHRLGEGGMGSVWSAEHLELRSKVAVKLIVPRYAGDPGMLSRFVREARSAAALRSPHVVQIFDSGIDQDLAFIVMEQLEGESLAERLAREHHLSLATTANVLTQVGRAITRAHEANLVHRDLKPENIFLVRNEDDFVAKVLDFGIAKVLSDDEESPSVRTKSGSLLGSPYYMSPEQARGRDVDFRSDLWALGVLAYECLLGQRPFRGDSLGEVILSICTEPAPIPSQRGDVPAGFDAWFARATARNADDRFQSARELAAALRNTLTPDARALSDPPEITTGVGAVTPRVLEGAGMGNTTGQPTSSEVRRAAGNPLRLWPVLAVAAVAIAALVALVHRGAGDSNAASSSAQAAQPPPSVTVAAPTPTTAATAALGGATAASVIGSASPLASTPAVPVDAARPLPRRTPSRASSSSSKPTAAASASAKPVKDPLSTRF